MSLAEITNSDAAQSDNNQRFHIYELSHSQIPEENLGVFSYFPGRQTGNRTGIFSGLQTKILTGCGLPL